MTTAKYLGIWMDHSNAHLMEFTTDSIETEKVDSKFTHQAKKQSLGKSEKLMHNSEQHEQAEYYKQLGERIRNYEFVILFGPTHAKDELFNILKADHHFAKIKIETKSAPQMSDVQRHTFVKDYFSNQIH